MSEELKPVAWLCTTKTFGIPTSNITTFYDERDRYKEEGRKITPLYMQSQLDAQSAYIDELTEALYLALPYVECYEGDDDFKQDKIKRDSKLIRNVLANSLKEQP